MENKAYKTIKEQLKASPKTWAVTGAAGFIGSHLVETLLALGQKVIGVDNFSTGSRENLQDISGLAAASRTGQFRLLEGDITDNAVCREACHMAEVVLHHAAVGSVPLSIADPWRIHHNNVNGSMTLLLAARDAKVKSFIYASSSSVYGDEPTLPKKEDFSIPHCLSPYAATKVILEQYAAVFQRCYGMHNVGLRYFNVYGPRQNPSSQYGAVIPTWIRAALEGKTINVYGDGETTRDFCYVDDVVQANILATTLASTTVSAIYNIGMGLATSLNQLLAQLTELPPCYQPSRVGDIRHSWADIEKASLAFGYQPLTTLEVGLAKTFAWYQARV